MRSIVCASPRLRGAARSRGFTLVELMVVISIIVVLAGLTFSVVINVRGRADDMACQHRLREMGMALLSYEADHGKVPGYSGREFLAELYRADLGIEARQLICPCSDEAALDDYAERAEAALEGKRGDPVGAEATTYFARLAGKGRKSIRSERRRKVRASKIPIVCDGTFLDPETGELMSAHGDYMFVLYLDGHVERVDLNSKEGKRVLQELGE
jgi:prepilin-type N-terminal cleavage/methylation domain-containing protein/prepilin-type processing-associated H-X9-DG protein